MAKEKDDKKSDRNGAKEKKGDKEKEKTIKSKDKDTSKEKDKDKEQDKDRGRKEDRKSDRSDVKKEAKASEKTASRSKARSEASEKPDKSKQAEKSAKAKSSKESSKTNSKEKEKEKTKEKEKKEDEKERSKDSKPEKRKATSEANGSSKPPPSKKAKKEASRSRSDSPPPAPKLEQEKKASPARQPSAPPAEKAREDSRSSSSSSSRSSSVRRRRKEREAARGAGGFSMTASGPAAEAVTTYMPNSLLPVPDKVQGLLQNSQNLAFEVARMKQAVEAASHPRELPEERETVLKMATRLHECLLDPVNRPQLMARTNLESIHLNEEGMVVLKASSKKGLQKAMGQLKRIAYHCQWGCNPTKVAALLAEQGKPVQTVVVRLAATSNKLHSHEERLSAKVNKLRIGSQAGACRLVLEGVPGVSRKHCTITFEPDKGTCYVQDLSTNGTFLNGKRLPRPPYKNPQEARVRLFHGDELFFRLRTDDAEELGYVVNILELS